MRAPSGTTTTNEDEDSGASLDEDFSSLTLDDDFSSFLDDEDLSEDFSEEEDSSEDGSTEVEELSSPQAANINADEIKRARNLYFMFLNIDNRENAFNKKEKYRLSKINLRMIRIFTDQTTILAAFGLPIFSLFVLFQAFFRTFAPESIFRDSFSGAKSIFFA